MSHTSSLSITCNARDFEKLSKARRSEEVIKISEQNTDVLLDARIVELKLVAFSSARSLVRCRAEIEIIDQTHKSLQEADDLRSP